MAVILESTHVLALQFALLAAVLVINISATQFDKECKPIDLVFVVDSSGSINDDNGGNYDLIKLFLKGLSAQLNVGPSATQSHIGVVIYSKDASVVIDLNQGTNMTYINKTIDKMIYLRSSSNIAEGIELARTKVIGQSGDRKDVMNIIVVISDGMATLRVNDTLTQANMAKEQQITVLTIGITNKTDTVQLKAMSSNNKVLFINTFQELNMQMYKETIINATCIAPARVITAPVGLCGIANVVFVVDGSGSMEYSDSTTFTKTLQLVNQVIADIAVGTTGVFASVVTFSDEASLDLKLAQRYGAQTVQSQLSGVTFKGGRSNIAGGLRVAVEHIINVTKARNENAFNFVVLISDGYSNINREQLLPVASDAKEQGIFIITATLTRPTAVEILKLVSSNHSVFDLTSGASVQDLVNSIAHFTCLPRAPVCQRLDITFLLDSSASINFPSRGNVTKFDQSKTFIKQVTSLLSLGPYQTQVAVVSFSDYARYEFFLRESHNRTKVNELIDGVRYIGGQTNLAAGLQTVNHVTFGNSYVGDRHNARNVLVIISDAILVQQEDNVMEQLKFAVDSGTYILSVANGDWANPEWLKYVSSNNALYNTSQAENFYAALNHLTTSNCFNNGDCGRFDLLFVLDSSDSVLGLDPTYWPKVTAFVQLLLSNISVDHYFGSQVALISFSDVPRIELGFKESSTNEQAAKVVTALKPLDGGQTDLTAALQLSLLTLQSKPVGNSVNNTKVVVLITDGDTNKNSVDLEETAKSLMDNAFVVVLDVSRYGNKEVLGYIGHLYIRVPDLVLGQGLLLHIKSAMCNLME